MSFHMDLSPILEMTEGDLEKIFSITSEVIALEIVNRIFITFFEVRKYYKYMYGWIKEVILK